MKLVFFSLFFVLFLVIFNYALTLMGSIYIVGDLGGSHFFATYLISFYALGNALGVPLGRSLSGKVGTVNLLTICLVLFALFTLLAALAPNYPVFITVRFLQGLVSGPFYTLCNRLFGYLTPPEKKQKFTGILLAILTVGPIVGATFGGWIAYSYDWRIVFYLNIPFILAVACILYMKLRYVEAPKEIYKFDFIGYCLFFVGVFCLSFALITQHLVGIFTIVGSTFTLFFLLWSAHVAHPVLELKFLKNVGFVFGLLNLAALFAAYFGSVVLLALWLSLYVHYNPIWVGVLLGTMLLAGLLPTFMLTKFSHIDCRLPLLIAIALLAYSCFHTSGFKSDITFGRVAYSRLLAGFGLSFFLAPLFRLCFGNQDPKNTIDVVVFFQFVRALASGLGVSLFMLLWQRRNHFYHSRLIENFMNGQALDHKAVALALDDCFYLMGWLLVSLIVLMTATLFFKPAYFKPSNI